MSDARETHYTTGRQHTADEMHELADLVLCWRPGIAAETASLNARVCAALLWHRGWEYEPAVAYAPAVRKGRRIVQKEVRGRLAGIRRHYRHQSGVGMESTPAPAILSDIAVAWHLLNGRVLIHLSDIAGDGLPHAKVGGGEGMTAIGEAYGGASAVSTLAAAILRCEAHTCATCGEHQPREVGDE